MDSRTILELYEQQGIRACGQAGVGALQHGWQCARLARAAGAAPSLQLAAWLHDFGHLMDGDSPADRSPGHSDEQLARAGPGPDEPSARRHRNQHALRGAAALLPLFGPIVSGPVALHVEAKRCLVALSPGYRRGLTSAALHQLALQGGAMPLREARAFLQRPHAPAALRLRLWDDAARDPHAAPPSATAALEALARLMRLLVNGSRVAPLSSARPDRPSLVLRDTSRAWPLPADAPAGLRAGN